MVDDCFRRKTIKFVDIPRLYNLEIKYCLWKFNFVACFIIITWPGTSILADHIRDAPMRCRVVWPILNFTDFILSLTPVLDESIPWKFYLRNSFSTSRRLLLIQWLVMANILSHAYKGSILSSLINIHYEDPLDTIEQMVESGLPFYVLGKTSLEWVIKTDPRDSVKKLNARRFDMPWDGHTEEKYLKM